MSINDKMAYDVLEAARITSVSPGTIHRAIHTTDPRSFPPPLRAKRVGLGSHARYLILTGDLMEWLARFPDG